MQTNADTVQARRDIDALTEAFFKAVSFQEGDRPAYDTLYSLFIEQGLLIRDNTSVPEISTVSQFIAPRQASVEAGELTAFRESELKERTDIFGNVAHRLITYEKWGIRNGTAFEGRGIISIQFVFTEAGWRMSSMAWDDERDGLTIPELYR